MFAEEYVQTESGLFVPRVSDGSGNKRQVAWTPQSGSQTAFLAIPEIEALLAGPRGTGKSVALLMDFCQFVGMGLGPDLRGVVLRHSQPQQSEIIALSGIIKNIFPGAAFNHQKSIWEFETGESLKLDHFDRPEKYQDFIGKSFAWIGWEELTTWRDDVCYKLMMSCLRTINPKIKLHVRSTTNPSGPGHHWVKKRFRLNGSSFAGGKVYGPAITDSRDDAGNLEQPRRAVLSRVSENLLLLESDPGYIDRILSNASSAAQRLAWGEGNWDLPEGGFLSDIWPDLRPHVVVPNVIIPQQRRRLYRGYDHGFSKPFAVLWFLVASGDELAFQDATTRRTVKGDIYIIDELYGCLQGKADTGLRLNPQEIARRIVYWEMANGWRAKDGRRSIVKPGPADGIWGSDDGRQIWTEFAGLDVEFTPPTKGPRTPGWALVRQYIENAMPEPKSGIREHPGLFVCERCVEWLRTVPVLPADPKDLDDVDSNAEDHLADLTRYFLQHDRTPAFSSGRVGGM